MYTIIARKNPDGPEEDILHAVNEDSVRTATDDAPPKTLCGQDAGEILKLPPGNVRLCAECADLLNPGAAAAQRAANTKRQAPLIEEFRHPPRIGVKKAPKSLPGQLSFGGAVWGGGMWVAPEKERE